MQAFVNMTIIIQVPQRTYTSWSDEQLEALQKRPSVLKIYVVLTKYIKVTEYGSSNVSCSSITVTITISITW